MRRAIACFGAVMGLIISVLPASAVTLGTDASYDVDTIFSGPVSDQDGPNTSGSGSLYSSVNFGGGEGPAEGEGEGEGEFETFGSAFGYASDTGALSGGAFLNSDIDVNSMHFHGSSSWSDSFTNTTGGSALFDFDFNFVGGRLTLDGNGGMSMFSLDILLDGNSIWNRTASLTGNPTSGPPTLVTDGLAHGVFGSGNYVDVSFDPFSGNLDLGTFGDGDSFTLSYNLDVWASTTEEFSFAEARVGDPFGVGFSGGVNAPVNAPVPEPTSMALLGMGLVGLAARARKSKKQA